MFLKLFSLGLLFTFQVQAAIVAELANSARPQQQHIVVAGTGGDLGTMFLESALGKVAVLMQNSPDSKIILVSNINSSIEKESALVTMAGMQILRADNINVGVEKLAGLAPQLPISSLSIYSHSAVSYGVHLYKGGRYSSQNPAWNSFQGRFTESGYIYLYGCNTGYELAPALSEKLQIPVAGTLTSAEFQYLDSSSRWRYSQPIADIWGPGVSDNRVSLAKPVSCKAGGCIRMQPLYQSYSGYWGDYKNGSFPAFKFFCAGSSQNVCERTMARSLWHQLNGSPLTLASSKEEFKKALVSFMCPRFNDSAKIQACESRLLSLSESGYGETFSPVLGYTLQCDAESCRYAFDCKRSGLFNADQKCSLKLLDTSATTFVDEYRRYLRGYSL